MNSSSTVAIILGILLAISIGLNIYYMYKYYTIYDRLPAPVNPSIVPNNSTNVPDNPTTNPKNSSNNEFSCDDYQGSEGDYCIGKVLDDNTQQCFNVHYDDDDWGYASVETLGCKGPGCAKGMGKCSGKPTCKEVASKCSKLDSLIGNL